MSPPKKVGRFFLQIIAFLLQKVFHASHLASGTMHCDATTAFLYILPILGVTAPCPPADDDPVLGVSPQEFHLAFTLPSTDPSCDADCVCKFLDVQWMDVQPDALL